MVMSAAFVLDGIDVESVLMADSLSPSSTRNQVCTLCAVCDFFTLEGCKSEPNFCSLFNDWGSIVGKLSPGKTWLAKRLAM